MLCEVFMFPPRERESDADSAVDEGAPSVPDSLDGLKDVSLVGIVQPCSTLLNPFPVLADREERGVQAGLGAWSVDGVLNAWTFGF
jgi:hypothetical protein